MRELFSEGSTIASNDDIDPLGGEDMEGASVAETVEGATEEPDATEIVEGEVVEGALLDGEIHLPAEWLLAEESDQLVPQSEAEPAVRSEEPSMGALPIDIELDEALLTMDPELTEPVDDEPENEGAGIDFGGALGDEEGVSLDDIDLGDIDLDDELAIGHQEVTYTPGGGRGNDRRGDTGALPLNIDLDDEEGDLEMVMEESAQSGNVPMDAFDLWDSSLAGEWKAEPRQSAPRGSSVRELLEREGVTASTSDVPLSPLYQDQAGAAEPVEPIATSLLSPRTPAAATASSPGNSSEDPPAPSLENTPESLNASDESVIEESLFDESISLLRQLTAARREHLELLEGRPTTASVEQILSTDKDREITRLAWLQEDELDIVEETPVDAEDDSVVIDLDVEDAEITYVFDEGDLVGSGLFDTSAVDPAVDAVARATPPTDPLVGPYAVELPEHDNLFGTRLLGVIPPLQPLQGVEFPAGSLALAPEQLAPPRPYLPGLLVDHLAYELDGWVGDFFEFLKSEAYTSGEPARVARAMHGLGRILIEHELDGEHGIRMLEAAHQSYPAFLFNDWYLTAVLEEQGTTEALLAHVLQDRSSTAERQHYAGHAARRAGDDPKTLWAYGLGQSGPVALAQYLSAIGTFDWEMAYRSVESLSEGEVGGPLDALLALERARLADETVDHVSSEPDFLSALENTDSLEGAAARSEFKAVESGNLSLLVRALQRMLAGPAAPTNSPIRATLLAKLALAHNRAGHFAEALTTYEALLDISPNDREALRRAALLAKRTGKTRLLREFMHRLAETAQDPREAALRHYENGVFLQRYSEDDAAAEAAFRAALLALPTFTPALARLSRLSRVHGRNDEIKARYVAEIQQMEKVLEQDLGPEDRHRTIAGLVRRYYRLAGSMNRDGQGREAIELHKRALALDPDALPSLVALERLFRESGDWGQLVALLLGWSLRTSAGTGATVEPLLQAADVSRSFLKDPDAEGQLLARVLNVTPKHGYALARAAEHFARGGQLLPLIEVQERIARTSGASHHQLRIAILQSCAPEHSAGIRQARETYRGVLDQSPGNSGAIEGVVRTHWSTKARLTGIEELDPAALVGCDDLQTILAVIDGLLLERSDEAAARLLAMWRARRRADRALSDADDAHTLGLMAILFERLADWPALVDTLEEQALIMDSPLAGGLLARLGEIWELRIGELPMAEDAYRRSIEADPGNAAAQEGLRRLNQPATVTIGPELVIGGNLGEAHQAALRRDRHGVAACLTVRTELLADEDQRVQTRALAAVLERSAERLSEAFEREPGNKTLFDALRRAQEKQGDQAGLIATIERHLPFAEMTRKVQLQSALVGLYLRQGEPSVAQVAAERLLDLDPASMLARLVLRRVASATGASDNRATQSRALLNTFRSPEAAAEMHHAQAMRRSPQEANELLIKGVRLDPHNAALAQTLEARLEAADEYRDLDALHEARLKVLKDPSERLRVARARARLLGERLHEPGTGLEVLEAEFAQMTPDAADLLLAARFCQMLGYPERADDYFEQALVGTGSEGQESNRETQIAYAMALLERGDYDAARERATEALVGTAEDLDALRVLGEVAAKQRQWRDVIKIKRRLLAYEPEGMPQAQHALGIGEIFSRVYQDHDRALGWFCKAVERAPLAQSAVRRLVAELGLADPDEDRLGQVNEVVRTAVRAREDALRDEGAVTDHLDALFELRTLQGDEMGQLRVALVLQWLGRADDTVAQILDGARGRFVLRRPLDSDDRSLFVSNEALKGRFALLFEAALPVLTDALSPPVPVGIPRLSRRSFKEWQAQYQQLALQIGATPAELWNGGRALDSLWATYLPHPAIALPINVLEQGLQAEQRFAIARQLEGLRLGRHLLTAPGVEAVATMLETLCGLVRRSETSEDFDRTSAEYRLMERLKRLPRPRRLRLEGADESRAEFQSGLETLRAQGEFTQDKVGLLAIGDIQAALDLIVFGSADRARRSRQSGGVFAAYATSARAQSLVSFFVDETFARLCRFDRREHAGEVE